MTQTYQVEQILDGLNKNQTTAVTRITDSTLVIAGAGSGKTAVLTRRIAFLIANGVTPGNILALTFTNKAAKEMNQRIDTLLAKIGLTLPQFKPWIIEYTQRPLLATFHALGVRVLREFYEYAGLKKDFSILDSDDQKKIIKDILKEKNLDPKNIAPNSVTYFISNCKQELLQSQNSRKLDKDFLPIFHEIYKAYEQKLLQNNSVDFDDLILLPYLILRDNSEVLEVLQNRFSHILVDEFQDTNSAQFELIQLLMPPERIVKNPETSIFVVGDDAQSIYAFRGSKIELILNFHKIYPKTQEVILNQNYRSTQPILDLAEKIISQNPKQKRKELFTENPDKIQVNYYLARNEADEAEYILRKVWDQYGNQNAKKTEDESGDFETYLEVETSAVEVRTLPTVTETSPNDPFSKLFDIYLEKEESNFYTPIQNYSTSSWEVPKYDFTNMGKLNDVVILYRTHAQSRSLEETFLKYKLPYKLVSGTRFLDRKEVKDVISILKFILNPQDLLALARFLPLLMDGVGAKTLQKILVYLETKNDDLSPKVKLAFDDLMELLMQSKMVHTKLIDFAKEVISISGYQNYLKSIYPNKEEYQARMENIGEIYSLMLPFETEDATLEQKLQLFLENISLMGQLDNQGDDDQPKISLMSLHQSKGLEFETVFLVGVEDGLLPHQNSFIDRSNMEEEVRLAYVGITRAKKYLHLIAADSRVFYGRIQANPLSRIFRPFLDKYAQRQRY